MNRGRLVAGSSLALMASRRLDRSRRGSPNRFSYQQISGSELSRAQAARSLGFHPATPLAPPIPWFFEMSLLSMIG